MKEFSFRSGRHQALPRAVFPYLRLIFLYSLFVFAFGLLIRLSSTPEWGPWVFLSSALLDIAVISAIVGIAQLALRRIPDELPYAMLILVAVLPALLSGVVATSLIFAIRAFTPVLSAGEFQVPEVYAYTVVLALLYNVQFLWLRHARLAAERAQAVSDAEHRLMQSELRRLRTQIQPHVLFNMLNTIAAETRNCPGLAEEMLERLSDYMRNVLELETTIFVSLGADIHSVQSLMALQRMRFGDRMVLDVDVPEEALRRQVPTFLLLPLVENATKFAARGDGAPRKIMLRARCLGDELQLSLTNPGTLQPHDSQHPGTRTGLSNLRGRLALHYPDRHRLTLTQEGGHVVARITVTGAPC